MFFDCASLYKLVNKAIKIIFYILKNHLLMYLTYLSDLEFSQI